MRYQYVIDVIRLFERKKNQYAGHLGPAPNNFLQDLLKLCRTGIYKILKFKRNQMGTIKTRPAIFSNINTRNGGRNGRVDASQPV